MSIARRRSWWSSSSASCRTAPSPKTIRPGRPVRANAAGICTAVETAASLGMISFLARRLARRRDRRPSGGLLASRAEPDGDRRSRREDEVVLQVPVRLGAAGGLESVGAVDAVVMDDKRRLNAEDGVTVD